jgi:predicted dehydrogenase
MKVLFFGLGGIGQRHLRNLLKIDPASEIAAVRKKGRVFEIGDNLQPNHEVDIMARYNITSLPTIEEAAAFNPDFAVVANPTSLHPGVTKELLLNGIPVFLEKPISAGYDGLEELMEICEKKGPPTMVGYMMRFHPCALKLKELIDNRRIGKIYSVILIINSYIPGWHSYEKYNEFYAGMRSLGGGVVLTEIHELDLFNWYFGLPDRLWAVGGKLSPLDIDVEDTVSVLMEQEFNDERFPVNINMSFVQQAPLRRMFIQGERGRIEWDIASSIVNIDDRIDNKQHVYDHSDFQRNEMFVAELAHFIECIKQKKAPLTSLPDVIGGHLTTLAIKDSLENNSIIRQPDISMTRS